MTRQMLDMITYNGDCYYIPSATFDELFDPNSLGISFYSRNTELR